MSWYIQVLKKYAVFSGRARRKEFWYFFLFNLIMFFVVGLTEVLVWADTHVMVDSQFIYLYLLAVLLPSIAVSVRRLHDIGRSAWWLLIGIIPYVGPIILLIPMVFDSQEGANQYGPSPKLVEQQPLS